MSSSILETTESTNPQNAAVANRGYVTFEEYLEQSSDTRICEWVDGEIITMPGASFEHQDISGFLLTAMRIYVTQNDSGIVLSSPFAMKLEEQRRGREPDILFVSKERQHLFKKTYLDGAADLAVEIISPESIGRDRGEKFIEYEAAGIKEYWIIDPDRKITEFYRLGENGFYNLIQTPDGIFRSEVLSGFFLKTEWLWQNPLPTRTAFQELNLI
ncbi:Uma2 family endonuclease [soil metagenome]